uniref:Uncharacterized protein n=1 Tax=Anguilla anguilla TaxID=7936 RepID=A0A0E9WTV7_ANGAN
MQTCKANTYLDSDLLKTFLSIILPQNKEYVVSAAMITAMIILLVCSKSKYKCTHWKGILPLVTTTGGQVHCF